MARRADVPVGMIEEALRSLDVALAWTLFTYVRVRVRNVAVNIP